MKKILAVAVHPDDETLGCGGALLRHKSNGDEIYWLIITNISEDDGWDKDFVERRKEEINKVAELYGFKNTYKLDFPTTELDRVLMGKLIRSISEVIREIEPETLYIPFCHDVHTDHQITFKALMSCTKNYRYPFIKKILMYETLSETEFAPPVPEARFVPNVFVDITDTFHKKLEIIQVYKSELMKAPLPRSLDTIEALAKYRGSRLGVKYAEAFMVIFERL